MPVRHDTTIKTALWRLEATEQKQPARNNQHPKNTCRVIAFTRSTDDQKPGGEPGPGLPVMGYQQLKCS